MIDGREVERTAFLVVGTARAKNSTGKGTSQGPSGEKGRGNAVRQGCRAGGWEAVSQAGKGLIQPDSRGSDEDCKSPSKILSKKMP